METDFVCHSPTEQLSGAGDLSHFSCPYNAIVFSPLVPGGCGLWYIHTHTYTHLHAHRHITTCVVHIPTHTHRCTYSTCTTQYRHACTHLPAYTQHVSSHLYTHTPQALRFPPSLSPLSCFHTSLCALQPLHTHHPCVHTSTHKHTHVHHLLLSHAPYSQPPAQHHSEKGPEALQYSAISGQEEAPKATGARVFLFLVEVAGTIPAACKVR